ncbi:MAG: AraC family transcriptional regulator [Victivallaceae bacterium]|nr:AraC family transcriptional regulator [Victivallaceae bacterium]
MFKKNIFFPDRTVHLSAMLLGCGHERVSSLDYRWDGLKRGSKEFCFWQYTLSGRGALRVHDGVYPVLPGEAMLLMVPEDHCYYLPEDSASWEFIYITMYGHEVMRLFHQLRQCTGAIAAFEPDSLPVRKAFSICRKSGKNKIADQYDASALAYDFLMALIAYVGPTGQGRLPEFINRVYEYCLQNIDRPLTVDEMAKCAGYSRYHFTRLFNQYLGSSPHHFMIELRIRMAVRLLQTERLSIKEIAQRCGFDDVSYFCKTFRKFRKVSPNEFRRG